MQIEDTNKQTEFNSITETNIKGFTGKINICDINAPKTHIKN